MAFTGFATYDDTSTIQEDIVDLIQILRSRTPVLNVITMGTQPAINTIHYWNEEKESGSTITNSTAVASATAATGIQIDGVGGQLQVGDLLEFVGASSLSYREQVQITSVVGANSILVNRGIGSVGPSSIAAGGSLTLISNAALEGSDFEQSDITRSRSQQSNVVQLFRKPISVSTTRQRVLQHGITDELAHQTSNRLAECMRDLELALLRGVSSATIGSDTVYRRMGGLWNEISTNVATFGTVTASAIDNLLIRPAVANDAYDLDLIIADPYWKIELDALQDGRVRVDMSEDEFGNKVDYYRSGLLDQPLQIVTTNNMLTHSMIVTSKDRVNPVNLVNGVFAYSELAQTGSATKGMIEGEYTAEFWHEAGMAKAYSS